MVALLQECAALEKAAQYNPFLQVSNRCLTLLVILIPTKTLQSESSHSAVREILKM